MQEFSLNYYIHHLALGASRLKRVCQSFDQLTWRCPDNPDSPKSSAVLAQSLVQTLLFSNYRPLSVFVNELTQYFMHILHILLERVRFVLWRGNL